MKSCITKHGLGSFRAPVIQVKVVFPGEAHASVNLDSAIAHRAARVARVKLGDGNSSGGIRSVVLESPGRVENRGTGALRFEVQDRKSTRLNSSHGYISYAVFCLKKTNTGYELYYNLPTLISPKRIGPKLYP